MIINDLDGCYIVFDTKNRNMELDTLINYHFSRLIGFLDKILTLGNVNKLSFLSLNRIFALSVNKISGTSG